ncbi:MAG: hypothetical protein JO340_04615 [Acidobacteriaceae bacterium]|nr:hypothetical protein [Acidobacteriaceae bacterium]
MSRAQFQLAYDGEAVRRGLMDVYELAPALLAIGDLVREVNHELNHDKAEVSVQVKSDFRRGSFEVLLLLDQNLIAQAKDLFSGQLANAKQILEFIFGTGVASAGAVGAVKGLLSLYKQLKGAQPKEVIQDPSKHITIIQLGDGQINVDVQTAALYSKEAIRSSLDKTVKPVARPGIDSLEVRRGRNVLEQVAKGDLPSSILGTETHKHAVESLTATSNTRPVLLRVTRANFEDGKWGFSDGNAKFNASIKDSGFKNKLDSGQEGFYKGDVLRVELTTIQTVDAGGNFKSEYRIDRVIEHIHPWLQRPLITPAATQEAPKFPRHDPKRLPPSRE